MKANSSMHFVILLQVVKRKEDEFIFLLPSVRNTDQLSLRRTLRRSFH